jgi:YbbR domain-containing protein
MAIRPFQNLALKVVSVVLAALLWLIVSGEQTVERVLRIPLEYTNIPEQLELVGEPPTVVDVRVRGSSGTLGRLSPGELAAVLDVRTPRPGQRLYHLTGSDVRAPFGVDVVQVTPSSIALYFEQSSAKTVPVLPVLEGQPAEGYIVDKVTANPAKVEIVGPASALKELTGAVTEAVSVEGATQTVVESVTVGPADPAVRLRGPQTTAQVTVAIVPVR